MIQSIVNDDMQKRDTGNLIPATSLSLPLTHTHTHTHEHTHEHTHTHTHEHTHSITPTRFLAVLPTSKILDLQYDFSSSVTPRLLTERQPLASCFMISRENGKELLSYPSKLAMAYGIAI